jgi:xylose isomerase
VFVCLLVVLQSGGIQGGSTNFGAKICRNLTYNEDLITSHVGVMDNMARWLEAAILEKSTLKKMVSDRYASWDSCLGK